MTLGDAITAHTRLELSKTGCHWSRWKVVYLYGLFLLISTFGDNIKVGPEVRLYEILVCRRYFFGHDPSKVDVHGNVQERYCKLDVIQGELSMLRGWLFSWLLLAGIFVTIPFGVIADSMGRKLVVTLSLISVTLPKVWIIIVCHFWQTFQPGAILFSAIFRLFGGGYSVLNAVVMAAVADAVTESKRTTILFYIGTVTLVSELAAPPLGSLLMIKSSPLITMLLATLVELSAILVLVFIPETLQHTATEYEALPNEINSGDTERDLEPPVSPQGTSATRVERTRAMPGILREAAELATRDRNILLTLPSSLVPILAKELIAFLLQYTSTKYGWTLAAATILITTRPAITIVLYTLLLPTLNRFLLMRLKLSAGNADLVAAKGSAALSVLGLLMIGASPRPWILVIGLAVFTLGWGYAQSAQLFLTSRVEKDQVGLLYTVIATISAIGGIVGAPLFAWTFSLGLQLSGVWLGLPFFVGASIYFLSGCGIWSLTFT